MSPRVRAGVRTTCGQCLAGCGVVTTTDGKLRGDAENPLSHGYLCANGRASLELIGHPERLTRPLVDGAASSWRQALDATADAIRGAIAAGGPDAVALYFGAGDPAGSFAFLSAAGFLQGLGSTRHYNVIALEATHRNVAAEHMFGDPLLLPRPDLERTRAALILGTNPPVTNDEAGLASSLHDLRERGGVLVVLDPRRTEIARRATLHLALRPGSDAEVLLAMLHVLLAEQREAERLSERFDGLGALAKLASEMPPERAADIADVDARDIRRAAELLAGARPVTAVTRLGVAMQQRGTLNEWLAWSLVAVLGSLDVAGGMVHNPGFIDFRAMLARGRRHPQSIIGVLPPADLAAAIESNAPDRVRVLLVVAADPLESVPDAGRLRRAFSRLDALVVLDVAPSATTAAASIVLPCAHHLEKEDVHLLLPDRVPRRSAVLSRPVAPPTGQARSEVAIFSELARRLGTPLFGARAVDWAAGVASRLDRGGEQPISPGGALRSVLPVLTRFALGRGRLARGLPTTAGALEPGALLQRVARFGGRVDLAPVAFVAALERSLGSAASSSNGSLVLSTCNRSIRFINGKTRILGRAADRAVIHLAPADAAERGLSDGELVIVETRVGALEAEVFVDAALRPGAAGMLFGTPGLNRITDGADRDPFSGIVALANVPVRISRKEASQ